jgi:RNA polymerase-interacting CarD/CdnL/TRCF family regulator
MVPVSSARDQGVREAITLSGVGQVWRVLNSPPHSLPADYAVRHELLKDKLHSGDACRVAEVLRDLAWRWGQKGHLTAVERRLYRKGVGLLAGEIAAIKDIDLLAAKLQVWKKVRDAVH